MFNLYKFFPNKLTIIWGCILKRVLIVTETGDAWPSGHIRALIYKDLFAADGIEVRYVSRSLPWLTRMIEQPPNRIINKLFSLGLRWPLAYLHSKLAIAREMQIVRQAQGYDTIYLQKVNSWSLISTLRRETRARLVYDVNDGVWLPSRAGFAGGKFRDLLKTVDAVTCDNPFGLEFARPYNAHGFLVPDPSQVELFDQSRIRSNRADSSIVLGWIGSPATLFNLYSIWEPLEKLFARFDNITMRIVGTGYDRLLLPRFEKVRYTTLPFYSQPDLIREVLQMDIGLFPLFDVEDSLARGILKATVYMSGEACVITPPVGQNCQLIADGENGVLALSKGEWLDRLTTLVEDTDMRKRMAGAGLRTVREGFSLQHCYNQLLGALT